MFGTGAREQESLTESGNLNELLFCVVKHQDTAGGIANLEDL